MVYKNFFSRLGISIILGFFYFCSTYNIFFLFSLATIIYIIIFFEIKFYFRKFFITIIFYLLLSYICFCVYFFKFFVFFDFHILVFSIILFDSLSYISGILIGKNYIFKKISPKKTFEGYVGGVVLTNLIMILFFFIMDKNSNLIYLLFFINFIIFFAIIGDLVQSYFKRKNYIKDSSSLLPGHGGFFDRFDSFLASNIFLLLYSIL